MRWVKFEKSIQMRNSDSICSSFDPVLEFKYFNILFLGARFFSSISFLINSVDVGRFKIL